MTKNSQKISRKKPVVRNRAAPEMDERVVEMAIEQPAHGQVRVSNEETASIPSCARIRIINYKVTKA